MSKINTRELTMSKRFLEFRSNPVNDDTSDGQWCAKNLYSIEELKKWKESRPDWAGRMLEVRRTRYAEHLSEVDAALLRKAKEGDTRAAELLYRRFENWTPKQADEALKRDPGKRTFAELIAETTA